MTSIRTLVAIALLGAVSVARGDFLYPDGGSTDGGYFTNQADYDVAYLFSEGFSSSADLADGSLLNTTRAYASAKPPAAGFPVEILLEFAAPVEIEAFHLWNITHPTAEGPATRGLKDFTLSFFDGTGGTGSQIGTVFSGSAATGPPPGTLIPAQTFPFTTAYEGVRSVRFTLLNNQSAGPADWVGLREIAFDGTATPVPNPGDPERIAVYLLGGQSNAFGQGTTAELPAELAAPLPEVLLWHGTSGLPVAAGSWVPLQPGSGASGGFGPELLGGRTLHKRVGSLATKIALVKYAKGGTSLSSDWFPGGDGTTTGDGPQYVQFQNTVQAALNALSTTYPATTLEVEGMIWHQGERDAVIGTHPGYEGLLTSFIADVRSTYGADLPFVIAQLSDGQTSLDPVALQAIQDAQLAVAAGDPRTGLVVTDDLSIKPDNLHLDTSGQIELGRRCGERLLALPLDDADGNGLGDAWEETHWGTGAIGQNPAGDPDHDGRDNATEWEWNTDPLVPDGPHPTLEFHGVEAAALTWRVREERRYWIQSSPDLLNWIRLDSFIPTDSTGEISVPLDSLGPIGFYRIGVQR